LHSAAASQPDQVSTRFLGAIERLEKRIGEMEHAAQAPASGGEINRALNQSKPPASKVAPAVAEDSSDLRISALHHKKSNGQPVAASATDAEKDSQVGLLVGKGQALLNLGQAEEALGCFEMAVALDTTNADVLVKRGMALEKLQKMEEAIDSYDRAIAANNSMTLAYLYKGAVCNRLQRFREALECYEKALTTEQKPVAS
jgi:tetratricopeptide (TPR) repeat protein